MRKRQGSMRRAAGRLTALAWLGIGALVAASPATAQEADAARAWVGIGLSDACARGPEGWSCARTPVIEGVVVGSPADEAGFVPGDTLLSIAGAALATATGDRALSNLAVGVKVPAVVGRRGQRVSLSVEPAPWPDQRTTVLTRTLPDQPARGALRVVPVPKIVIEGNRLTADVEMHVDSSGIASYSYRFRQPDGSVREFAAPRLALPERSRAPLPTHLDEAVLQTYLLAEIARLRAEGQGDTENMYDAAERLRRQYEAEVAPRLEARYDSALALARVRLDSLRLSLQALSRESVETVPAYASRPAVTVFVGPSGRRVAGAEFEELNPDLADALGTTALGVTSGLLVIRVLDSTPASAAGLRSGDVLIEADGRPIGSVAGLREALYLDEDALEVRWIRKGRRMAGVLGD